MTPEAMPVCCCPFQAAYGFAFVLTTLGIVYVQEAERRIPINYASRYQAGNLARQSYLPFKVITMSTTPC